VFFLVKPAFEEFCIPTKKFADVIVPRGADNTVAINLIVQHIRVSAFYMFCVTSVLNLHSLYMRIRIYIKCCQLFKEKSNKTLPAPVLSSQIKVTLNTCDYFIAADTGTFYDIIYLYLSFSLAFPSV
jgi:hypothetical protein